MAVPNTSFFCLVWETGCWCCYSNCVTIDPAWFSLWIARSVLLMAPMYLIYFTCCKYRRNCWAWPCTCSEWSLMLLWGPLLLWWLDPSCARGSWKPKGQATVTEHIGCIITPIKRDIRCVVNLARNCTDLSVLFYACIVTRWLRLPQRCSEHFQVIVL